MRRIIITESQLNSLIEQTSLNLKGKTIPKGVSSKHSSNYVSKDEENLFIRSLNQIVSLNKDVVPIHVRAYIYHLLGRTTPFTEKDMTSEERDFLKKAALTAVEIEWNFDYSFWTKIRDPQDPDWYAANRDVVGLVTMRMADQFRNFLGRVNLANIRVSPDKNKVRVIDNYDFNVKRDNLYNQVTEDLWHYFKSFIANPTRLYGLIRNLANMREIGGYNGYPVDINV